MLLAVGMAEVVRFLVALKNLTRCGRASFAPIMISFGLGTTNISLEAAGKVLSFFNINFSKMSMACG